MGQQEEKFRMGKMRFMTAIVAAAAIFALLTLVMYAIFSLR